MQISPKKSFQVKDIDNNSLFQTTIYCALPTLSLSKYLQETGGVNPSSVPPTLQNFLNSQACHGRTTDAFSLLHAQSSPTLMFSF